MGHGKIAGLAQTVLATAVCLRIHGNNCTDWPHFSQEYQLQDELNSFTAKEKEPMLLSADQTGCPLLAIPEAELEVHLLPITKLQFEHFVEASEAFDPSCYHEMLALNPKEETANADHHIREQIFVSGIKPHEANAFAAWMGEGFDLPTSVEWRMIYESMQRERFPRSDMFFDWASEDVVTILKMLLDQHPRRRMCDIMLMRGGFVEWTRHDDDWVGIGAPRPSFQPNLWNPSSNIVRPFQTHRRLHYFGFRLIRRGKWDRVDKSGGIYLF